MNGLDINNLDHHHSMREAIKEAEIAASLDQRPIGSVIVHDNKIIARGWNKSFISKSKLAHAEINAMSSVQPFLFERGRECVIYTTVEPCPMCLGAIVMNNIKNIVFGCYDSYAGAGPIIKSMDYIETRIYNYIGGIHSKECQDLILRHSPNDGYKMFNTNI